MKKIKILILACCVGAFFSVNAQIKNGLEIIKKNYEVLNSNDEQVELTMILINKNGLERTRSVKQYTKTSDDLRSAMIQFLSPADIKGTGLLSIENKGRDDDQWLYLPALKSTRQISSGSETDNFMGSDFTYEDLKREKINEFKYTFKGEQNVNGEPCYIIEAVPGNDERMKKSGYSKRIIYVSQNTFLFMKTDYYNKKGELVKVFTAENTQSVEGYSNKRNYKMTMDNLKTGNKTILKFSKYMINSGLQADLFTKRSLVK